MSKTNKEIAVNENILEIRFKPNPKVLDFRGVWAEILSTELSLPEWQIVENRVDIFEKQMKERIFVGYRNAGFTCFDTPTPNYFPDKVIKFLKILLNLEGFGNLIFIERIGVRYKSITPYSKDFNDLLNKYISRYLNLTDEAIKVLNAKMIDIGGSINFVDKLGNFNTVSGPMAKEQMKKFITREGEYPDVGLYYDIDYWTRPKRVMTQTEITGIVKAFATESSDKKNHICRLILGN